MEYSKICLSILLVAFLSLACADHNANQRECAAQENYNLEDMKPLMVRHFEDADEKFKCFSKCMFEKGNVLQDGNFREEGFLGVFSGGKPRVVKKVFILCHGELTVSMAENPGMSDCEKSYKFFMCIVDFWVVLTSGKAH